MTVSADVWERFDALVASSDVASPWAGPMDHRVFQPDLELLSRLLAVPLQFRATTQSGMPAKAVDVWVAAQLRRAGFGEDEVWPRATPPRVMPIEVAALLRELPTRLGMAVREQLEGGRLSATIAASDAIVLGKAYRKQIDVGMARWSRGVELMISTKRMDSSFGKNALNRIEESYGDVRNLRARHPLAAIGYLFVMRSTALAQEPSVAQRLIDLLGKLAQGDDGYDATGLLITEWTDPVPAEGDVALALLEDRVPAETRSDRFLQTLIEAVLDRTPIDTHVRVRELRTGKALPVNETDVMPK